MDESSAPLRGVPPSASVTSTADLLQRARHGDREAVNELFSRYLPSLPRWTRDVRDTDDVVQETLVQTLKHLDSFEPRHEGALQAYLRQALVNKVRDEVRRVGRHAIPDPIVDHHADPSASPLEEAIGREALGRYEAALHRLRTEEREVIIARVELGQSYQQIAAGHGKASADAARMAVSRALVRLAEEMDVEG
jgi:RNA polymerase sigma factor (sigma-70 family)